MIFYGGEFNPNDISIHAPVKGATVYPMTFYMLVEKFQSTHP